MRACVWVFGVGLVVGILPAGLLGGDPGVALAAVGVVLVAVCGVVPAGVFDDGSATRRQRLPADWAGIAIPPLKTVLPDWA